MKETVIEGKVMRCARNLAKGKKEDELEIYHSRGSRNPGELKSDRSGGAISST
jgi:hypothetical protein